MNRIRALLVVLFVGSFSLPSAYAQRVVSNDAYVTTAVAGAALATLDAVHYKTYRHSHRNYRYNRGYRSPYRYKRYRGYRGYRNGYRYNRYRYGNRYPRYYRY